MISILGHDFFILNSLVLAEASPHHPFTQQSLWKVKQDATRWSGDTAEPLSVPALQSWQSPG